MAASGLARDTGSVESGGDANYLSIRGVRKDYPGRDGTTHALREVSLDIRRGSFVSIVGPSGSGKSTLLQIVAGLLPASDGEVLLAGEPVVRPPRRMLYLFQQYTKSIFPWLTVRQNAAFGMRMRGTMSRGEVDRTAEHFLQLVGLEGYVNLYPWQLSGGMQQRVAIARALACSPDVLLMDEPFSAVDALTRAGLQDLVGQLWRDLGLTVLLVTHDIEEAVYLSERVVVLSRAPAIVADDVAIDLPQPRSQLVTREQPAYLAYRHRLLERILHPASSGERAA